MEAEARSDAVRCVVPAGDICGEGLLWSEGEPARYRTGVNRFLVHRPNLSDGRSLSWDFEEPMAALSLADRTGCILFALASHLLLW